MIGVIGLGYVGLPLCIQFARSGSPVLGFDVDEAKVESIRGGQSYIHHIPSKDLTALVSEKQLQATSQFERIGECDSIVICVPTPLGKHREPDISYVLNTGEMIAPNIKKGALVVLESTTYPGTTDEDLRLVLEKGSGLAAGKDFFLAFSPEREDPGNPNSKVAKIPKVVGGLTEECLKRAVDLYSSAVETVVPVSSCRAAEATKLLENIFRSVNIALVNELKVIYTELGIDIWEVIEAAKTKPFGFMPFYPGPGLGGHCIPIDPFYLSWKAREVGLSTRFIELAGEINTSMPEYVVHKLAAALNESKKPINGSRVLLIGLAYKANVDDERESPGFRLMDLISASGAQIDYFDPYIPKVRPTREHREWTGKTSVAWDRTTIRSYDAVVIATAHETVNYEELGNWSKLIIDTRNAMSSVPAKARIVKA